MRIAILTSSRADYSIYFPLLRKLSQDKHFHLDIIAFGTHLSKAHGYTVKNIEEDGFKVAHTIDTVPSNYGAQDISYSMGVTISLFSKLWNTVKYDLVFALGDRYEMFGAVAAGVPFNIKFAHIHGGETTLGAMDECFRHAITHMSSYHFTSTKLYAKKVASLIGTNKNIYPLGAMALDNFKEFVPLSNKDFKKQFGFELESPVLCTYHPVTKQNDDGLSELNALISVLRKMKNQIVITMPNTDNRGNEIRVMWQKFRDEMPNVILLESLGLKGYYTALKNCQFVIGNSSSGIIEAASFGKYVINIGDRQKGRITGKNVLHCKGRPADINKAIIKTTKLKHPGFTNVYGDGNTAKKIISILKKLK
ncbi:MAG: UDP-N-acetylglucosamine 2-epimerase (hydrolyzing) [Sphingobacteriaceae bacterium]|nr:UDP-N-acetylglucosamine 2-epimerase (hydrolyzing) [Sphingobacteriaceae bacterium]